MAVLSKYLAIPPIASSPLPAQRLVVVWVYLGEYFVSDLREQQSSIVVPGTNITSFSRSLAKALRLSKNGPWR